MSWLLKLIWKPLTPGIEPAGARISAGVPSIRTVPVAARVMPKSVLGGDYCSVIPLDDRRFAACICDATGHGLASALGGKRPTLYGLSGLGDLTATTADGRKVLLRVDKTPAKPGAPVLEVENLRVVDEAGDLGVLLGRPRLGVDEEHLLDALYLAVDLGGADAHAARVERGV